MLKHLTRLCAVATVALSLSLGVSHNLRAEEKGSSPKSHGPIAWQEDLAKAQKLALKEKKLIMVDFYADWCGPCKMMLDTTYKHKDVVSRSKQFVPLLIDVDKNEGLAKKYQVEAIPTVVFIDAKGKVITRSMGYLDAKQFLELMTKAKSGKS